QHRHRLPLQPRGVRHARAPRRRIRRSHRRVLLRASGQSLELRVPGGGGGRHAGLRLRPRVRVQPGRGGVDPRLTPDRTASSLSVVNLVVAHVVVTLPYAVRVVSASLYSVGPSIEEAAQVLGAGPVTTFVAVTLPMIRQGMLTAAIFSFVVSFDNFTLSAFLVSGRGTLPVEIYSYIRTG